MTISGGRRPEVFLHHVPFVSLLPDYETAMREHFARTLDVLGDDLHALHRIDRIHECYTQATP